MQINNPEISLAIHNLIAVLEDGKKGYLNAADKIKDGVLSLLFERFGYQRGRYCSELKRIVYNMGMKSPIDQYTLSLLQRTWMDLKMYFKHGKMNQVIKACIKAEENTLHNYDMAIEKLNDNDEVRSILLQHVNGIHTVLSTIKEYTAVPLMKVSELNN